MPYGNLWLVERHLCLCTVWGSITDEEIAAYDRDVLKMANHVHTSKLHTLYEMSGVESWPSINGLLRLKIGRSPKNGYAIIAGLKSHQISTFISVAGQLFGVSQRFCDTLPEALRCIQMLDRTLPDLSHVDLAAACEQARLSPMAAWLAAQQTPDPGK